MRYITFDTYEEAQAFCDKMWDKIKGDIPRSDKVTKRYDEPFKSDNEDKWAVHAPDKFEAKFDAKDKSKRINKLPDNWIKDKGITYKASR